jgi:hypothetical protein
MGVQIMEWCQASGYWTLERLLQACLTIDKWLDTGPVRAFRHAISQDRILTPEASGLGCALVCAVGVGAV